MKWTTQQESAHVRQGDFFRSVYIDVLDIGMLDFERVEDPVTKTALMYQGREGVLDFQRRMRTDVSYQIKLPDRLTQAIQIHSKPLYHYAQQGIQTITFQINPNCPSLVFEFYTYSDVRLHRYLHENLSVTLWARDEHGNTAYHLAVQGNHPEALKRLLAADPTGVEVRNHRQETPLSLAHGNQNSNMIAILESYFKTSEPETVTRTFTPGYTSVRAGGVVVPAQGLASAANTEQVYSAERTGTDIGASPARVARK